MNPITWGDYLRNMLRYMRELYHRNSESSHIVISNQRQRDNN
jgi:hypothetical protein